MFFRKSLEIFVLVIRNDVKFGEILEVLVYEDLCGSGIG